MLVANALHRMFRHTLLPFMVMFVCSISPSRAGQPHRIEIVDEQTKLPVCLVELRTVNRQSFISDNAGVIAVDSPDLMNREVWFEVIGRGYGVKPDGFGFEGVRIKPVPGGHTSLVVQRRIVAERIGRLTGGGLFAESQKCGERLDWPESPLVGCDSIQGAVYKGRMLWSWGDTNFSNYPLGTFDMTGAMTVGAPWSKTTAPLEPKYQWLLPRGEKKDPDNRVAAGRTKRLAPMPGPGPTWLTGYSVLKDAAGDDRLCAVYRKIAPPLDTYEIGLCVWNDEMEEFQMLKKLWCKSESKEPPPKLLPEGHTLIYEREVGRPRLLVGNPLPIFECEATFEAWSDPARWQSVEAPAKIAARNGGSAIQPHSGSIAWSPYNRRWVCVFMQNFGKPSAFGELWYTYAESPLGPWQPAVKVLTHANYTFYNPRIHGEFLRADSPELTFEGTYTNQFSDDAPPTPRYDYNQLLYRLNLDDPRLSDRKE